jgi:hypothetical protein
MLRKGRAILRPNPHNPIDLPYWTVRAVRAGVPDTYFTIPATIRIGSKRIMGFLTYDVDTGWAWTPEANPSRCPQCESGGGCRRINRPEVVC